MNQANETISEALLVINDREERDGNKVLLAIVNILEARISYSTGTEDNMTNDEKYSKILKCKNEIAEAWAHAPGWNTWVSVDSEGVVTTSHQTSGTYPHPDNKDYVMSLSYICNVAEENDDGEGFCHPEALWKDIEEQAERALFSDDE